jgi:hypothetical protein
VILRDDQSSTGRSRRVLHAARAGGPDATGVRVAVRHRRNGRAPAARPLVVPRSPLGWRVWWFTSSPAVSSGQDGQVRPRRPLPGCGRVTTTCPGARPPEPAASSAFDRQRRSRRGNKRSRRARETGAKVPSRATGGLARATPVPRGAGTWPGRCRVARNARVRRCSRSSADGSCMGTLTTGGAAAASNLCVQRWRSFAPLAGRDRSSGERPVPPGDCSLPASPFPVVS